MFSSPYPDEVIPKVSVYDFLFKDLGAEDAARVALIDGPSGAQTTYGALKAQIDLLAGALAARGLGMGDVVALHSPNVPAFATVFHGILRSGRRQPPSTRCTPPRRWGASSRIRRRSSCSR